MNKKKVFFAFVALLFFVFQSTAQTQMFSSNQRTETFQNQVETINNNIQIGVLNNQLIFDPENESSWTETIESRDTFYEGRIRIIQLWTETAYWELRQYQTGNSKTYRTRLILEYPYLGMVDRRIYKYVSVQQSK